MAKNELQKRSMFNKRYKKGKGWFNNPDAGDVEKNVDAFNHASNTGNITTSNNSLSVGEALNLLNRKE